MKVYNVRSGDCKNGYRRIHENRKHVFLFYDPLTSCRVVHVGHSKALGKQRRLRHVVLYTNYEHIRKAHGIVILDHVHLAQQGRHRVSLILRFAAKQQ